VWAVCVCFLEATDRPGARGRRLGPYMACERNTENTTGRISMKDSKNVL
jgi:hypothetical protein